MKKTGNTILCGDNIPNHFPKKKLQPMIKVQFPQSFPTRGRYWRGNRSPLRGQ
jgi:hypothetical protein